MPPDLQLLMTEFGFDAIDLAYNRRGEISKAQMKRVRKSNWQAALIIFGFLTMIIFTVLVAVTGNVLVSIGCIPLAVLFAIVYVVIMAMFKPSNVHLACGQPTIVRAGTLENLTIGTFLSYDTDALARARRVLDPAQVYAAFHTDKGHLLSIMPYDPVHDPELAALVESRSQSNFRAAVPKAARQARRHVPQPLQAAHLPYRQPEMTVPMSSPNPVPISHSTEVHVPLRAPSAPLPAAPLAAAYPQAVQPRAPGWNRPVRLQRIGNGWIMLWIAIGATGCALFGCFALLVLVTTSS